MKALESYRQTYIVQDYAGNPVAILNLREGAEKADLRKFMLAHVPNGVEIKNMADLLAEELKSTEAKRRFAEMTRKRKIVNEATDGIRYEVEMFENDARLSILNEIVNRYAHVIRYAVQPRIPQTEPEPGRRGRARAKAAQAALQAADATDPKLAKLLERRKALDEQILALQQTIAVDLSRKEAKIVHQAEQRAREVEQPAKPKRMIDRWREFMADEEANNPRKREAVGAGIIKER